MPTAAKAQVAVCLNLTRAISRTRTVEEIYANALDALEVGLGVTRASVLLFDPDGVMRFKASRGLSAAYRRAVEGHTPWKPDTVEPEPIVVSDVTGEPTLAALVPTFEAEGIAALTFVPLVSLGRVIGKFMLYYDVPHVPSAEELQLASVIASQIALAVERTHTEQARTEAYERANSASLQLAAIVESSGDAIVSKNLDGVITSWNRAAEEMFGYTASETIGRSIRLIIPSDLQAEEDVVLARIRGGQRVEMETRRQRRDGTILDISLMVSPVMDAAGRIVGASKIARDITERKRIEAERAELHKRLTNLLSASAALLNSPDMQSVVAATITIAQKLLVADGYALWATDPDEPIWRMVKSEGVSDTFASRVVPAEPAAAGAPLQAPLAVPDVSTQPVVERHLEDYRQEGVQALLACPMRLSADRSGSLVFYYRASREFGESDVETAQTLANLAAAAMATADLHDQLRSERNATEAARCRAAFLADATAILSRSLSYQKTLAAVARLAVSEIADWCAVDIVGEDGSLQRLSVAHVDPAKVEHARVLYEKYPPDPSAAGGVHDVIRTGKPILMESIPAGAIEAYARGEEHLRLLKELALESYMCVPLVSASGTLGAITFVYSESGRHYTERDLAFAQELSARAALAIENAHAYQRVNDANRVKDEFLATLSHELRTPLNAILGYAQMLSAGVLDGDRYANALTVLMRNAQALKQIIDDVLDVSRITSGKLRLNVSPVDFSEIIKSAVATVKPAADARRIAIDVTVAPGVPEVMGDPDRLQQVVWNLLSNSVKFTAPGGRVEVRLHQPDSSVEVVVSDNGQGIDPAFLPHMFERFRQADGRFSREHAGLGLGLAIVRELIELHGGTVSAASDGPGTGATFRVQLPPLGAHRVRIADRPRLATAPPVPHAAPERLKGARILAVDNEEDALGLLRVILESAGADVMTVNSAERALSILNDLSFDALIADIGMPGIDGLDLIRSVRQTLPSPANRVPAAALTAYARSEDRVTALASGFQMHIAKPVNPAELITAVAALTGR